MQNIRLNMTEKLFTGTLNKNQNKQNKMYAKQDADLRMRSVAYLHDAFTY